MAGASVTGAACRARGRTQRLHRPHMPGCTAPTGVDNFVLKPTAASSPCISDGQRRRRGEGSSTWLAGPVPRTHGARGTDPPVEATTATMPVTPHDSGQARAIASLLGTDPARILPAADQRRTPPRDPTLVVGARQPALHRGGASAIAVVNIALAQASKISVERRPCKRASPQRNPAGSNSSNGTILILCRIVLQHRMRSRLRS